jgi:hypothetical protein
MVASLSTRQPPPQWPRAPSSGAGASSGGERRGYSDVVPGWHVGFLFLFFCKKFSESPRALMENVGHEPEVRLLANNPFAENFSVVRALQRLLLVNHLPRIIWSLPSVSGTRQPLGSP